MHSTQARAALQSRLFPTGIPRLWCPSLTHFCAAHEPDPARIEAHLASIAPYVKGILVPGSTGEGWEMSDSDIHQLLSVVVERAGALGMKVLIGVLKTTTADMLGCMESMREYLSHHAVVGFTICPPKGSELSQAAIRDGLARVLELATPIALYQLPQVTQNEMSPETVASLAEEFPNFILFKDTSGADKVAKSGLDLGGVFLLRGSESAGYSQWLRSAAGPYDGFLLSTANVFARQYARLIEALDCGRSDEAQALSTQVSAIVDAAFRVVANCEVGNAFANANKILDHCRAYGDKVLEFAPPLLYSGYRLPSRFVEQAVVELAGHPFFASDGYLCERDANASGPTQTPQAGP